MPRWTKHGGSHRWINLCQQKFDFVYSDRPSDCREIKRVKDLLQRVTELVSDLPVVGG